MKKAVIGSLKIYKKVISPCLPDSCIYTPTCSEYGMEAVKRFGVVKGRVLTAGRLCRCNPFCKGGVDPVPDKKSEKKWLL